MSEAILSAISVISGVCAIVFGYIAFVRNRDSDKTKEAKSDATILTELGYIKGGTAGTAKDKYGFRRKACFRRSVGETGAQTN